MNKKINFIRKTEREEDEYLRKYSSTKPRKCTSTGPLYKECFQQKVYKSQDGGFLAAIPAILRIAGPFLLDYALNKFTGNGIMYKYKDGRDLSDDHKRAILLNIMVKYPNIREKLFE